MCSMTLVAVMSVLASALASAGNSSLDADAATCGLEPGPWAAALELWATTDGDHHARQGRIMALPPAQGYYVSDRIDLIPPPPPPHHTVHPPPHHTQSGPPQHNAGAPYQTQSGSPQHNAGAPYQTQSGSPQHNAGAQYQTQSGPPHHNSGAQYQTQSGPLHHNSGPSHHTQSGPLLHPAGRPYEEWQVTPPPPPSTSKIVNRPPNPYKDKFRPSYQVGSAGQPIPVGGAVDRIDEPHTQTNKETHAHKQVSETDLFLLSAIEKLVFRVDVMEKRLRKMEETVHYLVVGTHTDNKPEPCVNNFTRVGTSCYHFSSEPLNWKGASIACRKHGATLLELETPQEKRIFNSALLADKRLKGVDWWTGGLNPGLLWIWSHSARPVAGNGTSTDTDTVVGTGRCLALVADAARGGHVYRGQDCALTHRYVCEPYHDTTKLSNDIDRIAKMMTSTLTTTVRDT